MSLEVGITFKVGKFANWQNVYFIIYLVTSAEKFKVVQIYEAKMKLN